MSDDKLSDYAKQWRAEHRRGRRPNKVMMWKDVHQFVDARIEYMGFDQLEAECKARFADRAPSASSLHRYWQNHYKPVKQQAQHINGRA